MPVFALADCNNFYASCERLFQPQLNGKPVVVLSNNDGCVIARSNEAKALGIKMGAPYFQIEPYIRQQGIAVFSSNYALYGDLSQRVMQILSRFAPNSEVYSIDECFLDFSQLPYDLTEYSQQISQTVKQWTGIPISIGIGPTKTLAKLANRLVKKGYAGSGTALDWQTLLQPDQVLAQTALDDLWGISRRWASKLHAVGINHALDLKNTPAKQLRQQFGVVMERIAHELNGISCIDLELMPPPRKQILTSRSFGTKLTTFNEVSAAVSHFASRSAEKCRKHQLTTTQLTVFVQTSPFDTNVPQYSNSATLQFSQPSQSTPQFIAAAQQGLKRIFKTGYHYQRAGVLLPELVSQGVIQHSLFDAPESDTNASSERLMQTLDQINRKYGKQTLRYASEMKNRHWHMRQQFKSPSYTTNWDQVWVVGI